LCTFKLSCGKLDLKADFKVEEKRWWYFGVFLQQDGGLRKEEGAGHSTFGFYSKKEV
jgi:hypothetical protein